MSAPDDTNARLGVVSLMRYYLIHRHKNYPDIDADFPSRSFQNLADLYGEIYQVELGARIMVVSSQRLVNEVCNEDRFHKDIRGNLYEVRALTGDGLFTAAHEDGARLKKEANWWKAHRLLIPAFGPLGMASVHGG